VLRGNVRPQLGADLQPEEYAGQLAVEIVRKGVRASVEMAAHAIAIVSAQLTHPAMLQPGQYTEQQGHRRHGQDHARRSNRANGKKRSHRVGLSHR
jgi:hypothetical protein